MFANGQVVRRTSKEGVNYLGCSCFRPGAEEQDHCPFFSRSWMLQQIFWKPFGLSFVECDLFCPLSVATFCAVCDSKASSKVLEFEVLNDIFWEVEWSPCQRCFHPLKMGNFPDSEICWICTLARLCPVPVRLQVCVIFFVWKFDAYRHRCRCLFFHWNNEIHTICMLVVSNILVNTTQKIQRNLTVFDLRSYRSSWIMNFVAMDIWKFWYTYGWWFRNPTQPPGMYKTLLMGYTTNRIMIYRPKN